MGLLDNRNSFTALSKQGYSKKVQGLTPPGAQALFCAGFALFLPCLCGFSPGILASSQSIWG